MANFNSQHEAVLDELFQGHLHVRPGKMLGFPAYYTVRKFCVCVCGQGVGARLPVLSAARLLETDGNTVPFCPLGKPKMREWVQINLSHSGDYKKHKSVFDESTRYMPAQQEKVDS